MNKQIITGLWDHFRNVLAVTRKLVEQCPEDKITFRPTPEVRSFSEIVVHMYMQPTDSVATVAAGKAVMSEEPAFTGKAELLRWMDTQVKQAYAGLATLTDEQLALPIESWGQTFYAWQFLDFTYQEHLHHRGQLTVYLRLLGIEPFMIYDFEHATETV